MILLYVLVPVKEVYIKSVNDDSEKRVDDGALVELEQKKNRGVVCEAVMDGTDNPPLLSVTVGGVPQDGLFVSVPPDNKKQRKGISDTLSATARLEYITMNPLPEFNGQEILCQATTQPIETLRATAKLDVRRE